MTGEAPAVDGLAIERVTEANFEAFLERVEALFGFCVRQARERGFGRMEWCVLDWNEPAIRFYEKNGARRLDWFFYRLDREAIEGFPDRR